MITGGVLMIVVGALAFIIFGTFAYTNRRGKVDEGIFGGAGPYFRLSAAAYTIVRSAKALGLDVVEYLSDVLDKLARGVDVAEIRSLVPDARAAARATAVDPAGE